VTSPRTHAQAASRWLQIRMSVRAVAPYSISSHRYATPIATKVMPNCNHHAYSTGLGRVLHGISLSTRLKRSRVIECRDLEIPIAGGLCVKRASLSAHKLLTAELLRLTEQSVVECLKLSNQTALPAQAGQHRGIPAIRLSPFARRYPQITRHEILSLIEINNDSSLQFSCQSKRFPIQIQQLAAMHICSIFVLLLPSMK